MTARARPLPLLSRVQHIRSRLLSFTSQHKCLLSMRCLGTKVDMYCLAPAHLGAPEEDDNKDGDAA